MGDEIAVTETAKAVQEVAKTGRALIEPGTDLANYVARVLGTVPEDVVGFLIADPLHELRQHTLTGILRAAFEKLHARGVETAKPIRPGPGKEAFEAASLETDETLQDMWVELLANAMDPDRDVSLQRIFIDTLKQFEPIDAHILSAYLEVGGDNAKSPNNLASESGLRMTEVIVSAERLVSLGCLHNMSRDSFSVASAKTNYMISALGLELSRACSSPPAP